MKSPGMIKGLRGIIVSRGSPRKIHGFLKGFIFWYAALVGIYHIVALGLGTWGEWESLHRWLHLLSLTGLAFLTFKASQGSTDKLTIVDWLLIGLTLYVSGYFIVNMTELADRNMWESRLTVSQIITALILIGLVFEATRRVIGTAMLIVAGAFIIYAYTGPHWPGIFAFNGIPFSRLVDMLAMGKLGGLWGMPLSISATMIVLFLIFGGMVQQFGAGNFFVRLANSLTGGARGGPAKVAVISSALFGTCTGGAPSNVVVTGSFTIPAMKKVGFEPHFAGAVESVASTGGAITPPVMATVAYLMASFLGRPYSDVVVAALVPCLLFYFSVYMQIHWYAVRRDLKPLKVVDIPVFRKVILEEGELLFPIIVVVYALFAGWSVTRSALAGIAAAILIGALRSLLRAEVRKGTGVLDFIKLIFAGLEFGIRMILSVVFAVAWSGILLEVIGRTGLGGKISDSIAMLSGNSLLLSLLLAAALCLVLGMGISITASYILTVVFIVPAAVLAGVPDVAAHFFAVYFAAMAYITPPVALACYAAAPLAGADFIKIGLTSMRLGIAGFLAPFIFVYKPEILLLGLTGANLWQIGFAVFTAFLAVFAAALALEGGLLLWWQRLLAAILTFLLIVPSLLWNGIAIAVMGGVMLWKMFKGTPTLEEGIEES